MPPSALSAFTSKLHQVERGVFDRGGTDATGAAADGCECARMNVLLRRLEQIYQKWRVFCSTPLHIYLSHTLVPASVPVRYDRGINRTPESGRTELRPAISTLKKQILKFNGAITSISIRVVPSVLLSLYLAFENHLNKVT